MRRWTEFKFVGVLYTIRHELGVRRGYYPDHNGRDDAIILAKSLISDSDPLRGI